VAGPILKRELYLDVAVPIIGREQFPAAAQMSIAAKSNRIM